MNSVLRHLPLLGLLVSGSGWAQKALDITPLCDQVMAAVAGGATDEYAAQLVDRAPSLRVKDFRCLRALVAPKLAIQAAHDRLDKQERKPVDVWVLVKTKKRKVDKTAKSAFSSQRVELSRARQDVHRSKGSIWSGGKRKRVRVKAGSYRLLKVRVVEPVAFERDKVEARVYRTLKKAGVKSVILRPRNWK